jgi:uncharacterized protein YaaN involved in tellurite resistance
MTNSYSIGGVDMGNTNESVTKLKEEAGSVKAPTLTLDPGERNVELSFMEPSLGAADSLATEEGTAASAGSVDESMLSEEEKRQVEEFVKQIDISNVKMVNSYGAEAQKGISTFSSTITGTVKTKEFGKVGESLRELLSAINSTVVTEKKGFLGIFQKGKLKVRYVISNYESAEMNIRKIEQDLQRHQQVLTREIRVLDQMYHMNLEFYKELTMYIIAGKKALQTARNTKLVELRKRAAILQEELDVRYYRDYEDACKRFEKRIFDLEMNRLVSIQMAPQIRLLQNANQELVDNLRLDIINTIPLWRNQMLLALGINDTKVLNAKSAVNDATNEMLKNLVDVETLRKVNEDIIVLINEGLKIHEEGSKKRAQAQEEMAKIEDELNQALLEAGAK